MANISFKSITFPGLANKYQVPEISNDLMTQGKAADSKKVGDEISSIKADLGSQTGIISMLKDFYIKTSTTPISLTPIASTAGRMCAVVDCVAGDKFVINAYSNSSQARAWCFIDNANNAITMADEQATITDLELIAPANASKLIINDMDGGMSYKVGNNLASKMGSGLSDNAKAALLECIRHIARWDDSNGETYYNNLYEALYGVPILAPVIRYNPASDGLLSEQEYVESAVINDGASESLVNSKLVLYALRGGSQSSSSYAQYVIDEYNNVYGRLKIKAKLSATKFTPDTHKSGAFRVEVSNATKGAQFYIASTNQGYLTVEYTVGTTRNTVDTQIVANQFHDYEFIAKGDIQRLIIDGVTVVNANGLSTSYIGAVRLWAISGSPNNDINLTIDSVEYYDEEG